MEKIVLGLGSNLGNRENNINQAIDLIKEKKILTNIRKSDIIESKAMLPKNSPKEWDLDFLNAAIIGETSISAYNLLNKIIAIENILGKKKIGKWGPRVIDIDILAYGEYIIEDSKNNLYIPHLLLLEREWALKPFNKLWPNWQYPRPGKFYNKTLKEIVNSL